MKKINNWNDFEKTLPQDIKEEISFEVELIGKIIKAREAKGLSQKELATIAGTKQPAIARLENMNVVPKIDSLFKILIPLGLKLDIVPLYKKGCKKS